MGTAIVESGLDSGKFSPGNPAVRNHDDLIVVSGVWDIPIVSGA